MSSLSTYTAHEPSVDPIARSARYDQRSILGGDATFDEAPKTHSNNTQPHIRASSTSQSIPLTISSTIDAPRLSGVPRPSIDSNRNSQFDTSFDRRASNSLRASIARLEFLIHEAARLAENAHPQEDEQEQDDADHRDPTRHIKLIEHDQSEVGYNKIIQTIEDKQEALSGQQFTPGPTQIPKRSVRNFASIQSVKPVQLLPPILTGPESRGIENVAETAWIPWTDHKHKLDDIDEHLRKDIYPKSRKHSAAAPIAQASALRESACEENHRASSANPSSRQSADCRVSTHDLPERISVVKSHEPKQNKSSKLRVRFANQNILIEPLDISIPRKWRRPSAIPPGFFNRVENALGPSLPDSATTEEPSSDHESSYELQQFDEPLPVEEPTSPIILVNEPEVDGWDAILADKSHKPVQVRPGHERHFSTIFGLPSNPVERRVSVPLNALEAGLKTPVIDLRRRSHVDIYNADESFDVHSTCEHSTIARNWSTSKKRFTAFVACLNTACIGLLLGIYAGEVPAIQYAIADFEHYTILGNVFMYCGLAVSSFILWPLPLLHGRKPYMIIASLVTLALQIPQGLAINDYRDPSTATYKALLLASRGVSGLALGLLEINLKAIMLDCFGASLQSQSLSLDTQDGYDVRKHGGGMGMWLAFMSWSTVGPISIGFMVGASIVDSGASVSWGFWIALCLLLVSLIFTIVAPEVRRAAFRRTVAEMTGQAGDFSRVSRGEIKMHVDAIGPYWWGEEVTAGLRLSGKMVRQPGFLLLSLYTAWIYAQYSLVLMLLGSLSSKNYHYEATWVGLCTLAPAFGAIVAAPFQRASYFSRSRITPARTDSFTVQIRFKWSSHFMRRLLFMVLLPLCTAAYASASLGPPLLIAAPCSMAALVGFFTTMAIAESYGLIMEAFDTTDLQPGMTGRPIRGSVDEEQARQRTNFSCYPRVSAGFAITQALSFLLAAAATAVCGTVQRREGTVWTTTAVATISFFLTLLLTIVLVKWRQVQMIPNGPETVEHLRRANTSWRPVIIGRPSGKFRRLNIFELGRLTRYSQIRERNRLEGNLSSRSGMWS